MPIGFKPRSRDQSLTNQTQSANQVIVNWQRLLLGLIRGKEGHALLEERLIATGFKVLGRGEEWPENDVPVRVVRTNIALAMQVHEPLRPVPIRVLISKHFQKQGPNRFELSDGKEVLDGPLRHVTGSPAPARILLETPRCQKVNQGIVREPRENLGHFKEGCRAFSWHTQPRSRSLPVAIGIRHGDFTRVLDEVPHDLKTGVSRSCRDDADERLASGDSIRKEERIIRDRLKEGSRERIDLEAAFGKTTANLTVRQGAHTNPLPLTLKNRRQRLSPIIAIHRHMVAHQAADRRPFKNVQFEGQDMTLRGSTTHHLDHSRIVPVNPPTGFRSHAVSGGHCEPEPAMACINEDTQSV